MAVPPSGTAAGRCTVGASLEHEADVMAGTGERADA
jgi:hypothetical protein